MARYIDAIIYVRVPDWQIGDRVTVFFKDTMQVSGVCRRKPTADVVEVVRCKECKFYETNQDECVFYNANWVKHDDDFCPYGERRKEDAEVH